ncbi:peptidase M24 [Francisella halioticida]|uniref:Peptidase M24 n=1 Tax=Francisella halioticida TaxID=549298 RepID=A0ABM6LZ01_9GAMM|nr:Xaa-Pro peptidase family protein [Francisella halioticida]ASG67896.1 peptidase M24 [Francisella halioticida]BCD90601.1 peptidase M24 [Francisella halioticida]
MLQRNFPTKEFEQRVEKLQKHMHESLLDIVLFTNEANFSYFTGFDTQFWRSPTRPWFLLIPLDGKPIAVIPEIGLSGIQETWVDKVYTWSSPCPEDDGISLLSECINKIPLRYGNIGALLGLESTIRMPFNNFRKLSEKNNRKFQDCSLEIHKLRSIKSFLEIEKIQKACQIANHGFDKLPLHAKVGQTERDICRQMRVNMILEGADSVPYLIAGSGVGGYDSIIMGPTDKIIEEGSVLIIDTGAMFDGYYSDFDRNFAFGYADEETKSAYRCVFEATEAGFNAAKPGATTTDIYNAMWGVMKKGGALGNNVGRLGHGLGKELTEWPSHTATDNNILKEGMVITLEPGMVYSPGKAMVHEENIVITSDGAKWISRRASEEICII